MTTEQISEYIKKYKISTTEELNTHIRQLEVNTFPNKTLIFELYSYLEDWKHSNESTYYDLFQVKQEDTETASTFTKGFKENSGKTDYLEVDFDIIDLMAERFNKNKHKYPKGNMLKPIDEKELLMAMFRHWKKMFQPKKEDEETFEEHLAAILCNAQMLYQQRKLNKS